jgi:hypothetical protein
VGGVREEGVTVVDNEVFTSLKTSTTIKVVVYHYCSIFIGTVVVLADNHKGCPYIKPLIVGTGLVPVRMDFCRGLNQWTPFRTNPTRSGLQTRN